MNSLTMQQILCFSGLVLTHVVILAILLEIVVIVRIVINFVIFTAVSKLVANLGDLEDFYDNCNVS